MKGKVQLSNVHTDLVHMTDQPQWQIGLFEQKLVEWVFYYYHYVELYVNGVYLNHLMITRQTGSNGNVGIRCFMEEESQFQNEKGEKSAKKPKLSYLFCGIGASQILIGMTHLVPNKFQPFFTVYVQKPSCMYMPWNMSSLSIQHILILQAQPISLLKLRPYQIIFSGSKDKS